MASSRFSDPRGPKPVDFKSRRDGSGAVMVPVNMLSPDLRRASYPYLCGGPITATFAGAGVVAQDVKLRAMVLPFKVNVWASKMIIGGWVLVLFDDSIYPRITRVAE